MTALSRRSRGLKGFRLSLPPYFAIVGALCFAIAITLSGSAWAATPAAPASHGGPGKVTIEKTEYAGWPNCYRMTNGLIELVATTDVGPRIIRFGVPGGPNEFKEFAEMRGKTGGDEWRIYGGHRLWHSPEVKPRTYEPDNSPIEARPDGDTLHLLQPVEKQTGIRKEIHVTLAPNSRRVTVTHRLTNMGQWEIELAPWALSVMDPGGVAFLPQPSRSTGPGNLLANRTLVLWPYTDMTDPRHIWGRDFLLLKSRDAEHPTKIGINAEDGWAAYSHNGHLFVKRFTYKHGARYPDNGCAVELYTATGMLELETVGPLVTLKPGETVEHVETWQLLDGPAVTDEASAREAAKIIQNAEAAP